MVPGLCPERVTIHIEEGFKKVLKEFCFRFLVYHRERETSPDYTVP
jgi:hypothetical protein